MPIGTFVRRLLSPLEKPISDIYRNIFVNLADLTHQIHKWVNPEIILELGCGQGALTELLASVYPTSHIIVIDITPRVGHISSRT
jgi:trans-aconitate methyltransferase